MTRMSHSILDRIAHPAPVAWLATVALLVCGPVAAQQRKAPEKIKPGSCMNAGCHDDLAKGATVHRPVKKAECDACHDQPDETVHTFSLFETGPDLCTGCHKDPTKGKKFIHHPLKAKGAACTDCHEPHHSQTKALIAGKSITALCLSCHDDMPDKGGLYHQSAEVGQCAGCHTGHADDTGKFLRAAQPKLCVTCHTELGKAVKTAPSVHGPAATGCTSCHDPHQKRAGHGLKEAGSDLCMNCHTHFRQTRDAMAARHPLLMTGNQCLRCHKPHTATRKPLLRATSQEICLTCHAKAVKTAAGRTLPAMDPAKFQTMHLHGPLAQQNCGGCHEPHGNQRNSFLRGAFPATFYSGYRRDAYGLCFTCHKAELAEARYTAGATGFRNGQVNLHYVHVDKARKGRTCRVCHDVHASHDAHLVRPSAPFGTWQLPIGFTATKTGGTCASGCHSVKRYDRVTPVKPPGPPAMTTTAPAKAPTTKPGP